MEECGGGNFLPAIIDSSAAPPKYMEGGTEQRFPFFEFFQGGTQKKIVRENFCEVAAKALTEAGGGAESVRFNLAFPCAEACGDCQIFLLK